jgi:uncharacterized protein YbjT (DUF2867 family)
MDVFISGGTGYLGRALTGNLIERGHRVLVLARRGSERKVPGGAEALTGNALDAATFSASIPKGATLVHLTGAPHPAPWKGAQFRAIDLPSLQASASAAVEAGVAHFVYVSVAHPAPVMRAYIEVRKEGERILRSRKLATTVLRPWYVLGPGHRWPLALKPVYALLEVFPSTREGARRLGLVTLQQMVSALAWAVEHPTRDTRVLDVPSIRAISEEQSM